MSQAPRSHAGEETDGPTGSGEAHSLSNASQTEPIRWKTNLALFAATVVSVFATGTFWWIPPQDGSALGFVAAMPHAWPFAVPLLLILLAHEFGHYFAARAHRVPASLPYFIPLPVLSPLGTMGAVIAMDSRIKSRNALLDIGAAGPLAGLVVALPVLFFGLMHSEVHKSMGPGLQEGRSLLYLLMRRAAVGPIPEGYDVFLSPMAMAGWGGLFVTALNLWPIGQLDGGHVAYALFGKKQHAYARLAHLSLLALFVGNLVYFVPRFIDQGLWNALKGAVANGQHCLMWFGLIEVLLRVGGREHPPTDPGELSPLRRVIAVLTLILFVLLLMPTPLGTY
jgi:membrane-associated protease RseP (regulator of RpoE activity)